MNKNVFQIVGLTLAMLLVFDNAIAAQRSSGDREDRKNRESEQRLARDNDRRDNDRLDRDQRDRRDNDRRDRRNRRDNDRGGFRSSFDFRFSMPRYWERNECIWTTRTIFRNGHFVRVVVCVDTWDY